VISPVIAVFEFTVAPVKRDTSAQTCERNQVWMVLSNDEELTMAMPALGPSWIRSLVIDILEEVLITFFCAPAGRWR
jgi:hypothetical protein